MRPFPARRNASRSRLTKQERLPFILSFGIPVLVMLAIFIVRGIYPFGGNSFLRTDLYHQYAPFMSEFMSKIKSFSSLTYSWNIGLGSDYTPLYAYYLASPSNWLAFFVPADFMIEFLSYSVVIKIGLCGLAFCWYLSRHFNTHRLGISFFAIFYALSAYMAAYSWNVMWLDCLILAPIVMYGLERLVNEGRCMLYCLSLALCIFTNYYISIMVCIFLVIYFLALLCMRRTFKGMVSACVRFAGYSLLAGGLTAVLLIPTAAALSLTASGDISFPKTLTSYFSVIEMLARHFMNVDVEIGLDHWPNIYCGVGVIILLPLYLVNRKIPLREKFVKIGVLAIFLLSFSLNIPNFIWHGLHYPNSLPCRQSFLYIAVLLTMCCEGYLLLDEVPLPAIGASFAGGAAFILLCQYLITDEAFDFTVFYLTLFFVAIYAILLYFHREGNIYKPYLAILALCLLTVEAYTNTNVTSVTTVTRSGYLLNVDSYSALADLITEEDTDFYRIEKSSRKTKNDGALAGYMSASLFSSTANAGVSDIYKALGLEGNTNAYSFTGATPFSSALLAVKYTMSTTELSDDLYTLVAEDGDVLLYQNNYYLSLGFMIPESMTYNWDYENSSPALVQNEFASLASGCGDILVAQGSVSASLGYGYFTAASSGYYYIYVTNDDIEDVTVTIGDDTASWSNVDRGFLLDIGYVAAGTTVSLSSEQTSNLLSANIYLLDLDELDSCISTLSEQSLAVTEYTDTSISGTITASTDGLMFTSIPYDEGWTVVIDGVEVETECFAGAFIAVSVTEGTHTIEFTYSPKGLGVGIAVSAISLFILVMLAVLPRIKKRRAAAGIPADACTDEAPADAYTTGAPDAEDPAAQAPNMEDPGPPDETQPRYRLIRRYRK